jgi:hypothetical protein
MAFTALPDFQIYLSQVQTYILIADIKEAPTQSCKKAHHRDTVVLATKANRSDKS